MQGNCGQSAPRNAVINGFPLNPLIDRMSPEAWNQYAAAAAWNKEAKTLEEFFRKMKSLLEEYPFYARKLEQCCLERLLTQELLEPSRPAVLLHQYCESVILDAETLYRPEVLADPETYAIPSQYRFAVAVCDALSAIDRGNLTDSGPLLKAAIQIYPKMSAAVNQLLRSLEEQIYLSSHTVPEEFTTLGDQIKQVLHELIENEQWEEAYGVTSQLIPLLPDDLEVLRMKQEILRHGTEPVP